MDLYTTCYLYITLHYKEFIAELIQLQSNDDIHFIYFLHNKIRCISSMLTAKFSATQPTKSSFAFRPPVPHMKTENTAVCCYILLFFTTEFSAKRVIYIII
jgi:hypothetical protein